MIIYKSISLNRYLKENPVATFYFFACKMVITNFLGLILFNLTSRSDHVENLGGDRSDIDFGPGLILLQKSD